MEFWVNDSAIIDALYNIISEIPTSKLKEVSGTDTESRKIIDRTAIKAALISCGFSLPGGLAGFLTILPDLTGIWKLQRNMVADIAAIFGKQTQLDREQMLYCLFRHSVSQVIRDVFMKTATHVTVEQTISTVIEHALKRIGFHIARKTSSKIISRLIPVIGTAGAGVYAYYDTIQVGRTAVTLFSEK